MNSVCVRGVNLFLKLILHFLFAVDVTTCGVSGQRCAMENEEKKEEEGRKRRTGAGERERRSVGNQGHLVDR